MEQQFITRIRLLKSTIADMVAAVETINSAHYYVEMAQFRNQMSFLLKEFERTEHRKIKHKTLQPEKISDSLKEQMSEIGTAQPHLLTKPGKRMLIRKIKFVGALLDAVSYLVVNTENLNAKEAYQGFLATKIAAGPIRNIRSSQS